MTLLLCYFLIRCRMRAPPRRDLHLYAAFMVAVSGLLDERRDPEATSASYRSAARRPAQEKPGHSRMAAQTCEARLAISLNGRCLAWRLGIVAHATGSVRWRWQPA